MSKRWDYDHQYLHCGKRRALPHRCTGKIACTYPALCPRIPASFHRWHMDTLRYGLGPGISCNRLSPGDAAGEVHPFHADYYDVVYPIYLS